VTDDGRFTQAVSEVIWSGGRIAPGQFEDFTVSADPLPGGAGQLAFKAVQTYSDGHVVRWIDLPQPGQPVPDHPAPVLTLTTATAPVTASAASNASAAGAAGAAASGGSGADGLARALGAAGLALGLVALAVAGLGVRRRRGSRGRGSGPT